MDCIELKSIGKSISSDPVALVALPAQCSPVFGACNSRLSDYGDFGAFERARPYSVRTVS